MPLINVDLPLNNGVTPLYVAVEHGNFDIIKLLIEHGADPKKEQMIDINHLIAIAKQNNCLEKMNQWIQEKKLPTSSAVRIDALELAIAMGREDIVNVLAIQSSNLTPLEDKLTYSKK
jgi:ankyrin repeat protein